MNALTIAVIGAGSAGRGIARDTARAGYRTILEDLLPAILRQAESEIRQDLSQAAGNAGPEAAAALARVEYASSVEQAARQADLVIECVPDELESKLEIFILLDKICRPHTILASTASSLSIGEISSVTYRAHKCVGLRFEESKLEVVRGEMTDEQTVSACVELGQRMKKQVVVIEDSADPL
ncbi:MAG TPA: 3-hydroxyacyl-CoA dehydrogenase NAD-binding domain-containing protein [Verrucomicrobiae bacterium]|jgi:3-hydroxybutyryl-CoA dehydrogenase|nr:3-hydroxyacyl-CoA dehydrogenase NAD-binding domain-containing protein [Verrucomicrobiae bacterium]